MPSTAAVFAEDRCATSRLPVACPRGGARPGTLGRSLVHRFWLVQRPCAHPHRWRLQLSATKGARWDHLPDSGAERHRGCRFLLGTGLWVQYHIRRRGAHLPRPEDRRPQLPRWLRARSEAPGTSQGVNGGACPSSLTGIGDDHGYGGVLQERPHAQRDAKLYLFDDHARAALTKCSAGGHETVGDPNATETTSSYRRYRRCGRLRAASLPRPRNLLYTEPDERRRADNRPPAGFNITVFCLEFTTTSCWGPRAPYCHDSATRAIMPSTV